MLCRAANILLLAAKIAAFIFSLSFAVLASAADSLVDLASQVCEPLRATAQQPGMQQVASLAL